MATTLKPFRSNTAGAVPTTANLADGEMAINSADRKIFLRAGTNIVQVADASANDNGFFNGNFDIWQRGVNFTSGGYTADRWSLDIASMTSGRVYQYVFPPGTETVLRGNPLNALACDLGTSTSATASAFVVNQRIENVNSYNGAPCTVSFALYSSVAAQISLSYEQVFGTGGSATVTGLIQKLNVAVGWNYLSVTFTPPSVTGKTVGPGNFLSIRFWMSAGSNYNAITSTLGVKTGTRRLGNVKIEYGSQATPYVARPVADELLLCQRYAYVLRFPEGVAYAMVMRLGTTQVLGWIDAFCDMRVVPAASFLSGQVAFSDGAVLSSPTLTPASVRRVALLGGVASGTEGTVSYVTGATGNPAVILLDAEL